MTTPLLQPPRGDTGPEIRILYCRDCGSLEELPPFEGRPENDTLLEISVSRHRTPSGEPHAGNLFTVPVAYWGRDDVRRKIIDQVKGGSKGLAETDPHYYDSKSTFAEDALSCYSRHLRPKERCPDWRHDSKLLVPPTAAERKDLGLEKPGRTGPKTWLCSFCPANAYMVTRYRDSKGMYE